MPTDDTCIKMSYCNHLCFKVDVIKWKWVIYGSKVNTHTVPRLISIEAIQTTSRKSELRLSATVSTFPYLIWKGSSIVIQFLSLIGWANTKAPWCKKTDITSWTRWSNKKTECVDALRFSKLSLKWFRDKTREHLLWHIFLKLDVTLKDNPITCPAVAENCDV